MKKILYTILCGLALGPITLLAQSPSFEWVKQTGGGNTVRGNSMVLDASGNIYTVGYFEPSIDLDPGAGTTLVTSKGSRDIFVQKLDKDGSFVWGKVMGGTGYNEGMSIAVDSKGNVYTTGNFYDTVDFDPGAGVANLISNGTSDVFVHKLNSDGDFLWVKQIGGTWGDGSACIMLDANEDVYTTGYFGKTVDFDPNNGVNNVTASGSGDMFIQKLDKDGNFIWVKTVGQTNYTFGNALAFDFENNLLVTGSFHNTADFDPGVGVTNLVSNGKSDVYVLKLKANGDFLWAKSYGGPSSDLGVSLATDASGNVYVTGGFYDTVDFDPGVGLNTLYSKGFMNCFVQKLDKNGDFNWVKQLSTNDYARPNQITTDAFGSIYVTGYHSDTLSCDSGSVKVSISPKSDRTEIFLYKVDPDGGYLNLTVLAGTDYEGGQAISIDKDYNIITMGYFSNNTDFDPGVGEHKLSSPAYSDTYILKLSQCSNVDVTTTVDQLNIKANNLMASTYQWMACDSSMKVIPGATKQIYAVTANGSYAVQINENGCVDTSACVLINTVGILKNTISKEIIVYPNPTNGILTFAMHKEKVESILVLDLMGSKVMELEGNKNSINVDALPQGLYFLQVKYANSIGYSQFIKN